MTDVFTIGQLARRTNLTVRTIRFWSDSGLITPTGRSAGGYRLYDAEAVARLELVQTLRELGLELAAVREILDRQKTVAEVARAHVRALDAQLRTLTLRRAILRSVAEREGTTEEVKLMHRLAKLSAVERQRLIDDFVAEAFEGIDPGAPGSGIAAAMRQMPAELPADPTREQVDAWVELAELVGDPDFRRRVREMAVAGAASSGAAAAQAPRALDPAPVLAHAGRAAADGVPPESAEGRAILDRVVDPATPSGERAELAEHIDTFADRRVERFWQLMGVLNGRPPFPPAVAAFEWLAAALRAHG